VFVGYWVEILTRGLILKGFFVCVVLLVSVFVLSMPADAAAIKKPKVGGGNNRLKGAANAQNFLSDEGEDDQTAVRRRELTGTMHKENDAMRAETRS
jgi:hypothetical protein